MVGVALVYILVMLFDITSIAEAIIISILTLIYWEMPYPKDSKSKNTTSKGA